MWRNKRDIFFFFLFSKIWKKILEKVEISVVGQHQWETHFKSIYKMFEPMGSET